MSTEDIPLIFIMLRSLQQESHVCLSHTQLSENL